MVWWDKVSIRTRHQYGSHVGIIKLGIENNCDSFDKSSNEWSIHHARTDGNVSIEMKIVKKEPKRYAGDQKWCNRNWKKKITDFDGLIRDWPQLMKESLSLRIPQ